MIPEESRFERDPEELVEPPEGLPDGWQVGTPDPDDLGDLRRLTELLRAHERDGRGWAGAGKEDVLVEVSDHGLRTRQNVVVRDEAGLIRAWGSVHDRASGRMLFVHVVERGLAEQAGRACSDLLVEWAVGQAREVGAARGLAVQQIDTGAYADDERQQRWLARGRLHQGPHLVADEASGDARTRRRWSTTRCAGSATASWSGWSSARTTGSRSRPTCAPCTTCSRRRSPTTSTPSRRPSTSSCSASCRTPGTAGTTGGWPRSTGAPRGRWSGPSTGSGSYVAYIGVVELARGRGVAKGLLRTVIADAAARGRDHVALEVDADSSTGADRLYRGLGWETSYVTESWHRDVPVPARLH